MVACRDLFKLLVPGKMLPQNKPQSSLLPEAAQLVLGKLFREQLFATPPWNWSSSSHFQSWQCCTPNLYNPVIPWVLNTKRRSLEGQKIKTRNRRATFVRLILPTVFTCFPWILDWPGHLSLDQVFLIGFLSLLHCSLFPPVNYYSLASSKLKILELLW